MPRTEGSQKSVVLLCLAVHIATQQIKLATFSFIYYHCALLVNGLVNSGSHIKVTLSIGFWWFRARNFEITGLESATASPHSYETASGSVEVANS